MKRKSVSLDEVLDSMELFNRHEERMTERGVKRSDVRKVANLEDRYTFFKKKTDRNYHGECEHYGGYYLDGVHGAVSCSVVEPPLPDVVRELYCEKNCGECPLYGERHEERKADV